MNFQLSKNLIPGTDLPQKIYSIAWSPNMYRLAICQSSDKKVILFDEQGNKKEAFSTKPFKTSKNYGIKDLAFSADSTKLAIAQTDNIVFIYNLGSKWGDRKTICNKLEQEDKINCMIWPVTKPYEMYIGLINGKVKVGLLKSNSSTNLYSGESLVVSLACSVDGKYLISGHLDGYIYKFNLENSNLQKLVLHPSIPYCLSWGNDILACGNDNKVFFYNDSGNKLKFFDYSDDEKYKEFTVSKTNSVGDCIAIGNYNRFVIFMYNKRMQRWEESCVKSLEGLYSVSALCWKPDGSALVTGNLTGSVDIFEAFVSKKILREKFEVIYITPHQILVKNIERNKKVILKPKQSTIIMSFKLYKDNFVILTTKESIMFADIEGEKCSEIVWSVNGKEKFDFNNPGVCMIYSSGELTLIEYGNDEVVGYCRSEYIHNDLISCRIKEKVKIISFLIDLNTIYVQDLNSQTLLTSVSHEEKIDYLELNKTGTKLIFRDRKKQLFLFNLHENKRSTLLNYCGFVKWVPNSEVLRSMLS